MTNINIEIDSGVHREFKQKCVIENITLGKKIEVLIKKDLKWNR